MGKVFLLFSLSNVEDYDPTLEDPSRIVHTVDGERVCFDVLDTRELEESSMFLTSYIKNSDAFILFYSITIRSSFNALNSVHDLILRIRNCDGGKIPFVIVGNKCDLESRREVTKEEGQQLADLWGCPFFEASAKENINVDDAFFAVYREHLRIQGVSNNQNDIEEKGKQQKCTIM